jgi:hypothetical protein
VFIDVALLKTNRGLGGTMTIDDKVEALENHLWSLGAHDQDPRDTTPAYLLEATEDEIRRDLATARSQKASEEADRDRV